MSNIDRSPFFRTCLALHRSATNNEGVLALPILLPALPTVHRLPSRWLFLLVPGPFVFDFLELPGLSVEPGDYHRHLLPDLPGPLRMRQLLVWAAQKAALDNKVFKAPTEKIVEALSKNEITTSWYQRPTTESEVSIPAKGSKNQELLDFLQLHERYQLKLKSEIEHWKILREAKPCYQMVAELPQKIQATIVRSTEQQILCYWLSSQLPRSVLAAPCSSSFRLTTFAGLSQ